MTQLRQRMVEDMQMRNLSPHTQRAYIRAVARFAAFFHKCPDKLGIAYAGDDASRSSGRDGGARPSALRCACCRVNARPGIAR